MNKRQARIAWIIGLLVMSSMTLEGDEPDITFTEDKFENLSWYSVELPVDYPMAGIRMAIVQVRKGGEVIGYFLDLYYYADDWLFIRDGESLVFLLDGERLGLSTENPDREVISMKWGSEIRERAVYFLPVQSIERIMNTKKGALKLSGDPYYVTRDLKPKFFENMRFFYQRVVLGIKDEKN